MARRSTNVTFPVLCHHDSKEAAGLERVQLVVKVA
jgi:hypothetical protein